MSEDYKKGFKDGVKYALSHHELHETGNSMFIPVEFDPKEWWSRMMLVPHDSKKITEKSEAHFQKRIERWMEICDEINK